MSQRGSWIVAVFCLLLLSSTAVGAAAPSELALRDPSADVSQNPSPLQQTATPTNNTTAVRHENPQRADEEGNLDAVATHLAGLLAGRLSDGVLQLSQGQYEQAQRLLGDDYSDTFGQYVDIAGEVGTEQTAEQFNQTRSTQQDYTETVREFQTTYDEYRTAKRNGNDARARQLARELIRLGQQSNQTARQLTQSYTGLGNLTDTNFTTATDAVVETQSNITTVEAEVRRAELVQTRLSITTAATSISFSEPLRVSGRLTTQNGSPVADEEVVLRLHGENRTATTTTDSGSFSLQYRPTTLPQSTSRVTVRYVPAATSTYLGTNATTSIDVEPVNGALSITTAPEQAAFGEQVTIQGQLSVQTTAIADFPITVELGDTPLGTVRTTDEGQFELTTPLPAAVANGTRQLRIRLAVRDRAITATPATRTVEVTPTPTVLSANGQVKNATEQQVRLTGTLTTEDGMAVSGQPVLIRVNGTRLTTTQTDVNGTYQTVVSIPEQAVDSSSNITLVSVYDGDGTNLASAQTSVTLSSLGSSGSDGVLIVPSQAPTVSDILEWVLGWFSGEDELSSLQTQIAALPRWLQASGVLVLVLVSALGVSLYRRQRESPSMTTIEPSVTPDSPPTDESDSSNRSPLAAARVALRDGDADGTIEVLYGQVRRELATELEIPFEGTHWEFFTACQATMSDSRRQAIQTLTEWYEQAAYGPTDVSESRAREAITLAASILEEKNETDQPATDGGHNPSEPDESLRE